MTTVVGPLELDEIKAVMFDFTSEAASGAVLITPTVTVTVLHGTDASPSSLLQGSASITGLVLTQLIKPGVLGCKYQVRATVNETAGPKHGISAVVEVARG